MRITLAAARGSAPRQPTTGAGPVPWIAAGQYSFNIDDLHLDLPVYKIATRKLITRFIAREMGQNDKPRIASANGSDRFSPAANR